MKAEKGITLVSLVVTIVILLIIATVAINAGTGTVENVTRTAFVTRMQTIQAKVDYFGEKSEEEYRNLGQSISNLNSQKRTELAYSIGYVIDEDYRYFTPQTLEQIEVNGVEEYVIINFKTKHVVSVNGFKYKGEMFYTLEQLGEEKYTPSSVQY